MGDLDAWWDRGCIDALSAFLGCPMWLLVGSEHEEGDAGSATFKSALGRPHPGVNVELIVKLLTSRKDDGDVAVWALVFFFVDKRRVAEEGKSHLAIEWRDGQWHQRGWEADSYGEWEDLKTLD